MVEPWPMQSPNVQPLVGSGDCFIGLRTQSEGNDHAVGQFPGHRRAPLLREQRVSGWRKWVVLWSRTKTSDFWEVLGQWSDPSDSMEEKCRTKEVFTKDFFVVVTRMWVVIETCWAFPVETGQYAHAIVTDLKDTSVTSRAGCWSVWHFWSSVTSTVEAESGPMRSQWHLPRPQILVSRPVYALQYHLLLSLVSHQPIFKRLLVGLMKWPLFCVCDTQNNVFWCLTGGDGITRFAELLA